MSQYHEEDEPNYSIMEEEMPYLKREDEKTVLISAQPPSLIPPPVIEFDSAGRKSAPGKRKPCNCTRSQCLKLYCDCFANGEFCLNCNCKDCHNNLEFNHERSRAIKQSLEKNPQAFKPKIGVATKGINSDMERLHQKGCHCKKSNCLKNYCECYEAKVACTDRCKCRTCRNTEADRQVRFTDRFPMSSDFDRRTPISEDEAEEPVSSKSVKTHPWYYLTDDVVETTTMCLLGQVHESEQKNESTSETIKALCGEFGSCLLQIFDATRKAQQNELLSTKKEYITPSDLS
uniref:CRC domain-containing protein n=1 Tax=Panagrolaimus superbus TaxID=310955 RepID=A0A914ZCH7_9BILA